MADISATQTSKSQDWQTPRWLFDLLNKEFNFDLDVCATDENTLCDRYFTVEENGLEQEWWGKCWCNPPYNQANLWVRKAYDQVQKGNCTATLLIGSRTDTRYFWNYVRYGEIRFLPGRLKFEGGKFSAPFPSLVVVFKKNIQPKVIFWDVREPTHASSI